MKKILALCLGLAALAFAGPVSYYGKLQARDGKLYGANVSSEVQLKGMSLFWNTWDVGYNFYSHRVIDSLVSNWKVEIVRVAHGSAGNVNGNWKTYDDAVIQAAIDNDIYVIIDYHSQSAHTE